MAIHGDTPYVQLPYPENIRKKNKKHRVPAKISGKNTSVHQFEVNHITCFDAEPMPSEKSLGIILVMDFY